MAESGAIRRAVFESLPNAPLQACDKGAVALALRYAEIMDEASDEEAMLVAKEIGPKLHALLTALGMTPAGRKQAAKGGGSNDSSNGRNKPATTLAAIRSRRGAGVRTNGTAHLDATA